MMFLAVSCGEPVKFEDSQEGQTQTDEPKERGALGGKCFQNGTCNSGLICDEESNTCMKEPEEPTDTGTTEPTDTGTTEPTDTGTTEPTDTGTTEPTDTGTTEPTDTGTPEPTDTGTTEPDEDTGDTAHVDADADSGIPGGDSDPVTDEDPVPTTEEGICAAAGGTWNSSQNICTKTADCASKPANSIWNDGSRNGKFTQTLSGSAWTPASHDSSYNKTAGECTFVCAAGYNWDGVICDVAPTQTANCTGLPAVGAEWNTATSITQTWDGEQWVPSATGTYNETASTTECRFRCLVHYNWDDSTCVADTKNSPCMGLPENAQWNTAASITQTWNGSGWSPSTTGTYNTTASTTQCRYKCVSGYTYENGACINQKTASCTGLLTNAQWNTASSITQTWNGSSWIPSTTGTYNTTASTTECRFKCNSGYTYENGTCINQKTVSCTGLPANAQWNTASSITQNWNGSAWTPSATGTYNTTASTTQCRYKCKTNYNWNSSNSTCDAAKQTVNCTAKPANTVWNTVSTVTQTWTGSAWSPSNTSTYNETASTNACRYKCDSTHYWYNSECTSPCDYSPCNDVANSTKVCTATSWQDYSCGCNNGYYWWGTETGCTNKLSLGKICTGQTSCYNASSAMTCPSSSSADFYGQDAQYTSKCTAQSFSSSTNVVIDNNTGLTWEKSPSEDLYTWDNRATHCNELNSANYGGKSNWRVPNPLELLTIVDNSKYNPATNSNFTGMPTSNSTYLWTSKEYNGNTSYAYYFSPSYGWYWFNGTKTYTYKVLCVSGDEMQPATSSNFTTQTISGRVVVTDSKTGLMWQKEYETSKTWQQALKYCEDSTYAGYSDWRLPNKNELASLINYEKSGLPYSYFPDMPSNWFWSSSTYVGSTNGAWYVGFGNGFVTYYNKTHNDYVRCVR